MEIINAPDVTPMPFGILSVADVTDSSRAAVLGYTYQTICGHAVNFVGSPCDAGVLSTDGTGTATLTLPEGYPHEITVNWGDESEVATVAPGTTEVSNTYPTPGEEETPVYTVTVSGVGGSYEVAGLDPSTTSEMPLSIMVKEDTGELATVTSRPFVLHAQVRCNLVGLDPAMSSMTKLANAEGHVLESLLAAYANPTEQAALPVQDAVAFALATWFAATEGVRPIIHINASLLGYMSEVSRFGNHLETKSGALISAGTGYPTDRVILTSDVNVQRAAAEERNVKNPEANEALFFAERAYSFDLGCHEAISQSLVPGWETA